MSYIISITKKFVFGNKFDYSIEKYKKNGRIINIARSSNGRTSGFGPEYLGSNPSLAAITAKSGDYDASTILLEKFEIKFPYHV